MTEMSSAMNVNSWFHPCPPQLVCPFFRWHKEETCNGDNLQHTMLGIEEQGSSSTQDKMDNKYSVFCQMTKVRCHTVHIVQYTITFTYYIL